MLVRPVFIACCTYLLILGATFNGIFLPDVAALTLPLMGLLLIGWLVVRWRGQWSWHHTPLDAALMLWGAVIVLSLVANLTDWRRIVIGIWYVTLYMLIWYVLLDWLANKGLRRAVIVDGLLVAGVLILVFGYWQVINAVASGERYSGLFGLPRPGSLVGNPNSLAAVLIVMLGLAFGRWIEAQRRMRWFYGAYVLATGVMLLLTFSRGGWLGGAAALVIVAGLTISPAQLRSRFAEFSTIQRQLITGGVLIGLAISLGVGLVFLRSFSEAGRSAELRTYIWDAALALFTQKPLTGHGLFTFGKGLEQFASMPPLTPHSHAHSFPLHVLAELGLPGALAILVSLGLTGVAIRRNWQSIPANERGILIGGIAAAVGFGVHHLFDTPMMMPAVMLMGWLALIIAVAPVTPVVIASYWRRTGHALLWIGLSFVLIGTGWWSNRIYAQYIQILQDGLKSADYTGAAQNLQVILDADPAMPVYHWQQGMLYGFAAYVDDDLAAAQAGIAAFERALATEGHNATLWANVGALRWQTGDQTGAVAAFQAASDAAPDSWQLALIAGKHARLAGDLDAACASYLRAVEINGDVTLHPELVNAPTDCNWTFEPELSPEGEIARLHLNGDAAITAWSTAPVISTPGYVLRSLIASAANHPDEALEYLAEAEKYKIPDDALKLSDAWILLGQAVYAGEGFDAVYAMITPELTAPDYVNGVNIGRAQFLREVILRQFLPQVGYEIADPLLIRLLAEKAK